MAEPRSSLGRYQPERIDPEAAKRRGWRAHGILVVAERDPRLTWPERALVRQLRAKLYGPRREEDRRLAPAGGGPSRERRAPLPRAR